MTDLLILLLFAVAFLAGWCSRWQWDKAGDEPEEEPFERWAKDRTEQALNGLTFSESMISQDEIENQIDRLFDAEEPPSIRWAKDLP